MVFRDDIQGLRALAIIAVVAFHANASGLPGGFLGVDIFFVISGYLITGILLREIETNTYSIAKFYARRVLRLLPALVLMLAGVTAVGWIVLPPGELHSFAQSLPAASGFYSNVHFSGRYGYFTPAAELQPLLHTWSLAIEEQFYILFPIFLLVLKGQPKLIIRSAVWVAFSCSLIFAIYSDIHPNRDGFFSTIARAYELMFGALLALGAVPQIRGKLQAKAGFLVGLVLIAFSLFALGDAGSIPGWISLVPCAGCALIILTAHRKDLPLRALLSNRLAQFFGAISYALYLWHWPVLVFGNFLSGGIASGAVIALCILVAIALATASTFVVEKPILQKTWKPNSVIAVGILGIALSMLAGLSISSRQGVPGRYDRPSRALLEASKDFSDHREECHFGLSGSWAYSDRCRIGRSSKRATAVWGDSFGVELAAALAQMQPETGRAVIPLTGSSCPPQVPPQGLPLSSCEVFAKEILEGLKSDTSVQSVVLTAHYLGATYRPGTAERLMDAAQELALSGKEVFVVLPIPHYEIPVPSSLGLASHLGLNLGNRGLDPASFLARSRDARTTIMRRAGQIDVALVDPMKALCSQQTCHQFLPDVGALYFDSTHLSVTGAKRLIEETELSILARPKNLP